MSPPEGDGPTGVIHDIGYRHYTGPRLGGGAVTRALYVESLRGAYGLGRSTRAKIMPFLLLAAAVLPSVVIAVIASVTGGTSLPIGYAAYLLAINPLIALYAAGQAPAAVSRDLRFRTVTLYFSRPLRRGDYVRAKYAALATALFAFCALPQLVLYAGALLIRLPVWPQTRGVLVGIAGALLIGVVVTGLSLVIAAVTPRRGIGVAAVIAVLIVSGGIQGALQVLGEQQGSALAGYSGLINPFTLVQGVLVWAFSTSSGSGPVPPGTVGGLVYLAVTLVVAAGSYALLVRRYSRVSVS